MLETALYVLAVILSFTGMDLGILILIGGGASGSRRLQRYGAFVTAVCLAIGIFLLVHHH